MTNGLPGLTLNTNVININSFGADFNEVGQGNPLNVNWNVTGASSSPGGIVINAAGVDYDVSATPVGSFSITLPGNQTYTFNLNAHNGFVADQAQC